MTIPFRDALLKVRRREIWYRTTENVKRQPERTVIIVSSYLDICKCYKSKERNGERTGDIRSEKVEKITTYFGKKWSQQ